MCVLPRLRGWAVVLPTFAIQVVFCFRVWGLGCRAFGFSWFELKGFRD